MTWHLYDEHGQRAQKLTIWRDVHGDITTGWVEDTLVRTVYGGLNVLGFDPERTWRPTWFAASMARGWRLFELDVGAHEYVDQHMMAEFWRPAVPLAFGNEPPENEHRFRTIAALEMWLNLVGVR